MAVPVMNDVQIKFHREKRVTDCIATGILTEMIREQTQEPDLWLLFAPVKGPAMDSIVQKATELGKLGFKKRKISKVDSIKRRCLKDLACHHRANSCSECRETRASARHHCKQSVTFSLRYDKVVILATSVRSSPQHG